MTILTHSQPSSNLIFAKGRVIGYVEKGTFHKTVHSTRHFLRVPPAICLDSDSLRQAIDYEAVEIEIFDRDTRKVYRSTVDNFLKHSFQLNRGAGDQLAMILNRWNTPNTLAYRAKNVPRQLSLFGEVRHYA